MTTIGRMSFPVFWFAAAACLLCRTADIPAKGPSPPPGNGPPAGSVGGSAPYGRIMNKEVRVEPDVIWLGHSSLLIRTADRAIYVDPWKVRRKDRADLILITHPHHDHCNADDVERLSGPGTVVIGPQDALVQVRSGKKIPLGPGQEKDLGWVRITTVPAYNIGKKFHPRESRWSGFLIAMGGTVTYVAGDTDFIPEMKDIRADIAILPVGGTYTMDADAAAEAVRAIKPRVAIPIHFGDIVGTRKDAERFSEAVGTAAQVRILKPE